jgi:hypothetical protein
MKWEKKRPGEKYFGLQYVKESANEIVYPHGKPGKDGDGIVDPEYYDTDVEEHIGWKVWCDRKKRYGF